jgi:uncharacterized protein (TIGR03089 family)
MTGSLLAEAMATALAHEPGRPFVTYYDSVTGERVELSVTTTANWVAKTANLLVDGLGLGPGDTVHLALPRHWQLPVWGLAAWSAGLAVQLDGDPAAAQVAVCGPAGVGAALAADEVIALSLRPMGAPFPPGTLPAGVLDYGREVPGYGDRFDGRGVTDDQLVLTSHGATWTLAEAWERARGLAGGWRLERGGRLLVAEPLDSRTELLAATLVPLAVGGSSVLYASAVLDGPPAALAASERTTAVASP